MPVPVRVMLLAVAVAPVRVERLPSDAVAGASLEETLRLVGLSQKGRWPQAVLRKGEVADDVAHRVLDEATTGLYGLRTVGRGLSRVGFVQENGEIQLLYTVPLPLGTTLLDSAGRPRDRTQLPAGWVSLAPNIEIDCGINVDGSAELVRAALEELEPYRASVLDYWREAIEESTAVFDLLPKYFTTSQVRAVYERIWCQRQDPGNFHKWLHRTNTGIVHRVSTQLIKSEIGDVSPAYWDSAGLGDNQGSIGELAPKLVGISPWAAHAAGTIKGVAQAVAFAAGEIAYQADGNRGKPPEWFTRARPETVLLKDIYGPRPLWRVPGSLRND